MRFIARLGRAKNEFTTTIEKQCSLKHRPKELGGREKSWTVDFFAQRL
jgi:hypothetical protein